jgi:hypothetical protein
MNIIEGTDLAQDLENVPADMNTTVRQVAVDSIKKMNTRFNDLINAVTLEDMAYQTGHQLNSFTFLI